MEHTREKPQISAASAAPDNGDKSSQAKLTAEAHDQPEVEWRISPWSSDTCSAAIVLKAMMLLSFTASPVPHVHRCLRTHRVLLPHPCAPQSDHDVFALARTYRTTPTWPTAPPPHTRTACVLHRKCRPWTTTWSMITARAGQASNALCCSNTFRCECHINNISNTGCKEISQHTWP